MEINKEKLILAFDVKRYLDWHGEQLNLLEDKRNTELTETPHGKRTLNAAELITIDGYLDLRNNIDKEFNKLLNDIGSSFMPKTERLEILLKNTHDALLTGGYMKPLLLMMEGQLIKKYYESLHIFKFDTFEEILTLVKFFQYLDNELMKMKSNLIPPSVPQVIETKASKKNAMPLNWYGTNQSLYVLFFLLLKAKKITNTPSEIARYIIGSFLKKDGNTFEDKDFDSIKGQIGENYKPINLIDTKILDIITKAVKDIDNLLKIK